MGWREKLGVGNTGDTLYDEFEHVRDSIAERAKVRHQDVRARQAALDREDRLLGDLRERVSR